MNVVVAAGGRFHAIHLAHQLERFHVLKQLFICGHRSKDSTYVSSSLVHNAAGLQILEDLLLRLRMFRYINKSSWYVWKDNYFDRWLTQ